MKKKILSALLSTVLLCSFAACGGGNSNSGGAASSGSASGDAAPASSESGGASGTAEGGPKYGGVMRYASHNTVSTAGYTPECTNNASLVFLTIAYESLLYYDETGKMIPKLALEWDTDPSEPSITWTLRQSVQFADGEPFNAEAVKRNIEEYQACSRNEVANVASCEVIDEYTIKMVLKQWDSSTLEGVGFFVYYMSPKALENVDALRESSCGTGAFQVTEFNSGISVKYARNDNYWQEGKPYLDGVEMYIVDEPTTRSSAFQAGEYDIILMNNLTVAQELLSSGQYVLEENKSGVGHISTGLIPNSANPDSPFKDPKVRQAMCYAIDTEAICNTFGYGLLQTTNQWAVPGAVTYNTNVKGYPYDIEKAKALLAEAGYPDGFDTTFTTATGDKDMFTAAANMLTEAGIRCNVNLVDETAQVNLYSTGTWEGIMGHFHSVSPDLGLYMGRHLDPTGAFYAAGIQHPENALDLLARIRTAPSEEEKIKLEHEMQILIYDELALFGQPLYVQNEPVFKYDYLKDDRRKVDQVSAWSPENAWFDK